ncbi:MAG: NADH-quinone oxidoreductase subunit I [Terriglobales bacterium]
MSIAPVLRKVFLVDLLKGLSVTFRNQHPRELITEQYPFERPAIAERYRGLHRLNVNPDTGETLCIACELCKLACPEKLISLTSERNPQTKKKELVSYSLDISRCMFCGLCEDACPTDCLEMSQDYEFAVYDRNHFVLDRQRLEKGSEPSVYLK